MVLYCYTKRKIEVRGREGKRGEERGREGKRGEERRREREEEEERGGEGYTFDLEVLCHEPGYVYAAVSRLQEERHCQNTTTPR